MTFRTQGLKGFTELLEAAGRHVDLSRSAKVLDWGCGCGRFTRHFVDAGFTRVFGCDIDTEAIEWCRGNLAPASFIRSSLDPPLPYDDASVDVVIASSVFTHLSRDSQDRWLGELTRLLAPGGVALASVNGAFSLARAHRTRARTPVGSIGTRVRRIRRAHLLARAGIADSDVDRRLEGIVPSGYYRATYQTKEYTVRAWSEHLDVLEYVEHGFLGHQDLVVMRRPA